jgi:type II secretory pathway component GspD/PulD (secretin)
MGGPGTIQYFPLGHALIVNQTQEVQEDVLNLLQSLRRLQDLEVAIEVKLVQVADSFFERIGVDFDLNILTPKQKTYETQLLNGTFQPPGFINRFRPDNFISGLTPAGTFTSDLSVPIKGSSFDFSLPPFGNYPGTIGSDGGISLGLAFLSDIQVYLFMTAAQGNRRLNVMQAPRITVFNGQTATISIQDNIFFLISATPTYFGNTLAFVPQNQPFPVGMLLQVNPVVSADRRFVRMNLQPQITGISGAAVPLIPFQTVIPAPPTIPGAEPVFFQLFFQQPQFSQINLNTTVNVPDGGTVVLGGLKVVAEGRSEFGPPLLGKIPYLDRLFRNTAYGREAQNLMIMVTPRIIINEEEEQIYLGNIPPVPRP